MRTGPWRRLIIKELMLLDCGAGEDLRVLWRTRRSNKLILKEINPEYSLEGLMLKLKLQYFGYLMQRDDSLEKTLMLWKTEGKKRRGWQKMRWFDSITDLMDMKLSELQEIMEDRGAWHAAVHGVTKSWLISLVPAMILLHLDCHSTILLFHFQAKLLFKINPTACLLCFFVSCWR